MKIFINYRCITLPVFLTIAFFATSLNANAFLGLTRGQVKERLGEPEAKVEEISAEKYMANKHAYIIRYDATGCVDRCMISKMTVPDSFTPEEFNDLTKSMASTGFKSLKSDADTCLMLNHDTKNTYLAQRIGARKDWVVMTTYKAGAQPDLTFFKEVMRLLNEVDE